MEDSHEEKPLEGAGAPSSAPLKQIRTFQGDVAEALGREKQSLVSIQRAEQLKRGFGTDSSIDSEIGKSRRDSFLLLLGGFFLILLGLTGAWFGYQQYLIKTAPPVIAQPPSRFIRTESVREINTTNLSRESLISNIKESSFDVPAGELRHLIISQTSAQFLEILGSRAPSSLVRAFEPPFMLGSIGLTGQLNGSSRFIIFKLSSFANAFPGMLAWEPEIVDDLGPVLSDESLVKALPPTSVFKDMVVKNKDMRVLESVLVYSFFDNEMLIVTDKIETVQVLIDRLIREKLSR